MSMDNGNNGLYKTANTNFELCDNLKFIDVPQTSISQYNEKIKSRQATDNNTSVWKLPYSSTCTSTIRRTEECNIIARSLTELAVGIIPDTRRIRSDPEGLSSTIITTNPKINIIIESKHSTSASKITSLEKLDSLDIQKSGTTTSQIKIKNDVKTKSVASTIVSPVASGPCSKKSSWENSSTENESDYVVDPVQGTAYHKGQFLGKGGFARVYLMTDITNGKKYACKIIPKNRMQKIHIQKIAREIMIHKDLNHVNVVQMHHYFENSLNVYMLLEACPRKSLMHVLKYRGKVTEAEARYYMKQMVTGVAYIHSQHVVHRDLKPGNMFLSDGMIVKIGDFGLATRPDGRKRRVTICGTPNYIAPEVLYKQAYSYEADVWALGCILYALLAGQPPFDTATLRETYSRICNNRYKKLGDSVVSKTGHDLIHWLLQPIPELRPSLERVKEHPYLTAEFVPEKLAHSCCYRIPDLQGMSHLTNSQELLATPSSLPSSSLLSSRSCTSTASRPDLRFHRLNEEPHQHLSSKLHEMTNGITQRPAILPKPTLTNLTTVKKKSNVGNWLVRKFPKLSKLRHRIGRFLHPDRKKPPESVLMHQALECCLAEIQNTRAASNPLPIDGVVPMFVTKWIDYSNKYGLCFQLSDRSVGVLFNDSTKMSYACDRSRIEYTTPDDEVIRYLRERDVPSSMREKLELLRHFTEYMDEYLTNGGEIGKDYATRMLRRNGNVPRMRRWLRTDKAIVMELTVPLLQVNFFADHTKMVVSEGTRPKDYFVTYIDANRHATAYWLNDLRDFGCTAELYERLNYVCKASREFAQLENNAVCCEIPIDNGIVNNKA